MKQRRLDALSDTLGLLVLINDVLALWAVSAAALGVYVPAWMSWCAWIALGTAAAAVVYALARVAVRRAAKAGRRALTLTRYDSRRRRGYVSREAIMRVYGGSKL